MNLLASKFKEVVLAVLPITIVVILLNFTITPIETHIFIRFLIGAVLIVLGLAIFLFGIDLGITPIGSTMGSAIAKKNKLWLVLVSGLILGFLISIAEPDLHILAGQVQALTAGMLSKFSLIVVVSLGIAVMLTVGLLRVFYRIPLYIMLIALYGIILLLSIFVEREFLAIAFDASGATTGALTVPFVLAMAVGISVLKKQSKESEKDSFGLIGIVSTGAIIAVLVMSIVMKTDEITGSLPASKEGSTNVILPFLQKLPPVLGEVFIALLPIVVIFFVFQFISFKLNKREIRRIIFGIIFSFVGLVFFLVGVNAGFLRVGSYVGISLAQNGNMAIIISIGFLLGLLTILAEPAVSVLTHQIEDVTSGYVRRGLVMAALSIGVGAAVALTMLRILVPSIQLWHYLLPGYIIALTLTLFSPKLFVGIAFDSGGVASGPMTATFILAFAHGIAEATPGANVLIDGFGMIALVALAPIITLQLLGLVFKVKTRKKGVDNND